METIGQLNIYQRPCYHYTDPQHGHGYACIQEDMMLPDSFLYQEIHEQPAVLASSD